MLFEALHEEEVLSKVSGVLTTSKRREVVNDGVAQADVAEVNFLSLLELGIEIFGKEIAALDDEALLKDVDIELDGLAEHLDFSTEAFVGDLLSDPIGKQFH